MNADPLARWYRLIEYCAFGRALERSRLKHLDSLSNSRKILVLGEGDGRLLAHLVNIAPQASIDVVETSSEMIRLAQARTPNVNFIQQDARDIQFPDATYDAVVTCFFLDCFTEDHARLLVNRLARALNPGGLWLVTDFAIPPHGWRRWHATVWVWTMYRFFQLTTNLKTGRLPPIDQLLSEAGLQRTALYEGRGGLIISASWLNSGGR
jgi:ubiquinone/menaquinone biosynthesis C-methylase UbiE